MKLSVYSLKKVLYAGDAVSLNCKTMAGEITVLDNHESLIGVLTPGVMKVVEGKSAAAQGSGETREHFFEIQSGFLEVRPGNEVRCMVD